MRRFLSPNNYGISLLEAIIAIAVLALAILSITQVFPLVLKMSRIAEQTTIAANLAQAQAEYLHYLSYDGITAGVFEARHRLATDPANPFYQYERQTVVNYVDGNLANSATDTGLKKISITIYWQSAYLNKEKSFPLTFLVSEQ